MMLLLLLILGSLAGFMAAPASQCDLNKVAIVGGTYKASPDSNSVEYSCPEGKFPFPAAIRKCQQNGEWDYEGEEAECKDSECNLRLVPIVGGSYTISQDGNKVEYSCPQGKYPFPAAFRECQRNGEWTNVKLKAVCKAVECPKPVVFEGGEYAPRQGKYFVGDVLNFECWGGFTLFGSENRTCQVNGKWSGETAICDDQESHCRNPGIPLGATKVGTYYNIEGKVTYECQNGLSMFGSKERQCKENGKWSGREPSCRAYYTYDTPEEVTKGFGPSLAETIESSDPNRVEAKKGRKVQIRTGGPMNIFIIIDASSSVKDAEFEVAKEVSEALLDRFSSFDFVPRYSVLTYASQIKTIVTLSESEINTDTQKVIEEIQKASREDHKERQGTNTRAALQEVYNQLSLDNQRNPATFLETSNVIILLTDGKHNMGGDPVVEVRKLREFLDIRKGQEEKLDIYVFGLGNDISLNELNDIASKKEKETHVFRMENVEALKQSFDEIIDESYTFEMCGLSKYYSDEESERYPWIAKIKITRPEGVENCKGSIISKNYILTAAHCFRLDDEPHLVTVEIGGRYRNVKNLTRHNEYKPGSKLDKNIQKSFDYDLLLVELANKIEFSSKVRPICLPCTTGTSLALKQSDKDLSCSDHKKLLLTGDLLQASFVAEEPKDTYEEMNVNIKQGNKREGCLADAKKIKEFKDVANIKDVVTDNFLCTGGTDPVLDPQTCKGDSGGPLLVKHNNRYIQVGVISWGTVVSCKGYTRQRVPPASRDFHASIISEMAWLEKVVKEDLTYLP